MKKTLCWLIVMAMLIAMAPAVFADAEGGEEEGEVVTQVLLETTATTTDETAFWGEVFELVSPGAGTITVTFYINDIYPEYQVNVADGWGEWLNTAPAYEDPSTMTYEVSTGDAIQISVATLNADGEYVGGSVDFDVVFTGVIGAADEEEEEINTVLVEGMNTVSIEGGAQLSPQYTFTPEADGVLSLEVVTLICKFMGTAEDWTGDIAEIMESGVLALQVDGYDYLEPVAVTAGVPVIITMTQGRMYSNSGYGWEIGVELTVESDSTGEEPEDPVVTGMVLGNNVLEAASGNQFETTFTATETGTLYITIRNWAMNNIEYGEKMLDYGWSKLLVNGTAMDAMTDTLTVTAGDEITFVLTSDGDRYVANVFLSMEGFYEEPLGSEFNPVVLTPEDVPTTSIVIPAGETVWYKLVDFYDYELRVYGENAYIVSYYTDYTASWPYPLVPSYHYAEDGVAAYTIEYQYVMIGNAGTEAATFEIDGYLPEGLSQNPAELVIGEQTVDVAFEQYAYYIVWIAPSDGTLTLVFSGEMWRYDAVNVGDPNDWSDDGTYFSSRALDEEPIDTVVIEVKAGDLVRIDVGCSDAEWNLPSGSITINAAFESTGGEPGDDPGDEPIVGDHSMVIGDNTIELPFGATEGSVYTFVASETGTVYMTVVDFQYAWSATSGYADNNDYLASDWKNYTTFTVNGETLEGGFYGSIEVVAGETYTFVWAPQEYCPYGFKAVYNLSYTDELLPVVGIDFPMTPADMPMSTIEIPAGGQQLYRIDYNFSGYVLRIYGENVHLYYEYYDYWAGGTVSGRIDPVDGVIEYSLDTCGCQEFYICNDGEEAAVYEMDCYAPEGGEKNPIIVENLEDIYVSAPAAEEFYVYFQWTSDKLGTITVIPEMVNISFYNITKEEYGEWGSDWISYSVYVEPGDVLSIMVGCYSESDLEYYFTYNFTEGYRLGTEQNPFEADLLAGLDVDIYNETVYYTWTPAETMTITLNFTLKYEWSSNQPTITINGEAYTLGDELTVTAGEPVIIALSTTPSVYGTLQATVVETEEPAVMGDVNGDGVVNYLDAMLVAQFYVGEIDENGLNVAVADVNGDGVVNYLDAMLIAQFYVGEIDSFEP